MHVIKCCISRQIHTLCIKTGKQDKSKKYSQFIVINTACFNNSQFALTVQYVQKKDVSLPDTFKVSIFCITAGYQVTLLLDMMIIRCSRPFIMFTRLFPKQCELEFEPVQFSVLFWASPQLDQTVSELFGLAPICASHLPIICQ